MKDVRLLTEPFIPGQLVGPFANAHPGLGGVCTFVGEVRGDDDVEALELMHYEPLTLAGMDDLAEQALARFDLMGILIAHRVGEMRSGEPIVLRLGRRPPSPRCHPGGRFRDGSPQVRRLVLEA